MVNSCKSLAILVGIVFLIATQVRAQAVIDHWETIIYDSSIWRYFPGTSDPGADWMTRDFDDGEWAEGKGGVGLGDDDDRTIIALSVSVFLRTTFTISDLSRIERALLHVDYDDGYVAYINGIEINRENMGAANPVPYNQWSENLHEAMFYQNMIPEGVLLNKQKLQDLLVSGTNVFAIEVHNVEGSGDLSSSTFLSVGVSDDVFVHGEVPSWFQPPLQFTSSALPIIIINTHGQAISDDPRVVVDMGVINKASGINNIMDPFDDYAGKVSIEIRGESSQQFPKKSFNIETQNASGDNVDVSLLNLPKDNDWILYAPYTDKTMMRDVLTYKWGNQLGFYASRSKYVELVIDDDYKGVYVLLEKIKRNKGRVDIAKLKESDISGDDLTGGYILRVDKIDENDYPSWKSMPVPRLSGTSYIDFQFRDPKGEELLSVQQQYIKNFILEFESALSGTSFKTESGYEKFIDVQSFIDFMIIIEIGKNIDAYNYSTYMYKDKDSKDGKLHMGPLWDFNLAYGNVDYWANSQFAPGWMYNDGGRMYWFRRLMSDPAFVDKFKCRWTVLRKNILSNAEIMEDIDSIASVLNEPQYRNYKRWPILGVRIWPNQFVGDTYQEEIDFLKKWISARLLWMDSNMPGSCPVVDPVTGVDRDQEQNVRIYPNPSAGSFHVAFPSNLKENSYVLYVYNSLGQIIYQTDDVRGETIWNSKDMYGNTIASGLYTIVIRSSGEVRFSGKVIKH